MTQGSFHQTLKNRFKRWNKKSRFMMSINFTQQHFVWLHFFKNKILVLWVLGGGGGDWYLIFNFETPCMLLLLMMVSRDPRNNYRLVNRVNMIMMVKEKWQPAKKMCDLWINTCVLPAGTPSTSPVSIQGKNLNVHSYWGAWRHCPVTLWLYVKSPIMDIGLANIYRRSSGYTNTIY